MGLAGTVTHHAVTLTWDDPQDDTITHYRVLRGIADRHEERQFTVVSPDTGSAPNRHVDHPVEINTRHVYRIIAANQHGERRLSSPAEADTYLIAKVPFPGVDDTSEGLRRCPVGPGLQPEAILAAVCDRAGKVEARAIPRPGWRSTTGLMAGGQTGRTITTIDRSPRRIYSMLTAAVVLAPGAAALPVRALEPRPRRGERVDADGAAAAPFAENGPPTLAQPCSFAGLWWSQSPGRMTKGTRPLRNNRAFPGWRRAFVHGLAVGRSRSVFSTLRARPPLCLDSRQYFGSARSDTARRAGTRRPRRWHRTVVRSRPCHAACVGT